MPRWMFNDVSVSLDHQSVNISIIDASVDIHLFVKGSSCKAVSISIFFFITCIVDSDSLTPYHTCSIILTHLSLASPKRDIGKQ